MNARRVLVGLLLAAANATAFACDLPKLVAVPDVGKVGNESRRLIVEMQSYVTGIRAYTACIQAELTAAGGDAAPESLRGTLIRRNNAAVDEARTVIALFGERVTPAGNLYLAEFIAGEGEECIPTPRLESTAVVNDVAVLFIERGGQTYLNVLETSCENLERSGQFDIKRKNLTGLAQTNRLCANEFIEPYKFETSVVRDRECPLGRFFELTDEQAERLLGLRDAARPVPAESAADPREETPARRRSER